MHGGGGTWLKEKNKTKQWFSRRHKEDVFTDGLFLLSVSVCEVPEVLRMLKWNFYC